MVEEGVLLVGCLGLEKEEKEWTKKRLLAVCRALLY